MLNTVHQTKERAMYFNHLNGQWYTTKSGLCRTFRKLGYTPKQYYDEFLKTADEGYCLYCGKETRFTKFSYHKFCDNKCAGKYNQNAAAFWHKVKNEMTENERQDFMAYHSKVIADSHPKGGEWLSRREETYQEKYGMSHSEHAAIKWNAWLNSFSEEERQQFFDKTTSAWRKEIGRYKHYTLNGDLVCIQGYEPQVLDVLKKHFQEHEIDAGRKGTGFIRYFDKDGEKRRYFPDIILRDNIMIEVKSKFTFSRSVGIEYKMSAAKNEGFIPLIVIWDPSNEKELEMELIETISSQALLEGRFNDHPFIGVGFKLLEAEAPRVQ